MSNNRHQLDKTSKKNIEKNVKSVRNIQKKDSILRSDQLTTDKALSKYPMKRQKTARPLVEATIKNMEIKKKKRLSKTSKRTTPGEINHRESQPAYEHRQGPKIKKSCQKKNLISQKTLSNKIQKRRSSR